MLADPSRARIADCVARVSVICVACAVRASTPSATPKCQWVDSGSLKGTPPAVGHSASKVLIYLVPKRRLELTHREQRSPSHHWPTPDGSSVATTHNRTRRPQGAAAPPKDGTLGSEFSFHQMQKARSNERAFCSWCRREDSN